jgi:hypothetical protein
VASHADSAEIEVYVQEGKLGYNTKRRHWRRTKLNLVRPLVPIASRLTAHSDLAFPAVTYPWTCKSCRPGQTDPRWQRDDALATLALFPALRSTSRHKRHPRGQSTLLHLRYVVAELR